MEVSCGAASDFLGPAAAMRFLAFLAATEVGVGRLALGVGHLVFGSWRGIAGGAPGPQTDPASMTPSFDFPTKADAPCTHAEPK